MGSIISKIENDNDTYEYFCNSFNEKPIKVYSIHYYWIIQLAFNKTYLSYKEYEKEYLYKENQNKIKKLKNQIREITQEIKKLT